MKRKIVVGITGASGAPYARRLCEVLGELGNKGQLELAVCVSSTAPEVWALECGGPLEAQLGLPVWGGRDYRARSARGLLAISSGRVWRWSTRAAWSCGPSRISASTPSCAIRRKRIAW